MQDFTKEISRREMARFLIPLMFVELFGQLAGIANTAIISRFSTLEAVVCVSACRIYPIMQSYLVGTTATGFGVYVTRYIGKRDPDQLRGAVRLALIGAGVLTLAGLGLLLILRPLLTLSNVPADIHTQAKGYLLWLFAGSGALAFHNLFLGILYGLGDSTFAGLMSAANVFLQPSMTFLFLRKMELGAQAMPIATQTTRLLLAILMLAYLLRRYPQLFGGHQRLSGKDWAELWHCGLSKSAMLSFIWFGTFMLQRQVNRMPDAQIAAYMYAFMAEDMFLIPVYACSQATPAILAQNVGAGKDRLVRKYFWRLLRLAWLFCLALVGLVWLCAPGCVRLLAGSAADEQIVHYTVRWLHVMVLAFPAVAVYVIGRMGLQAVKKYRNMWMFGAMEGVLRTTLAVFVVAGAGFDAAIGTFFVLYMCNGIGMGLCCRFALRPRGAADGE